MRGPALAASTRCSPSAREAGASDVHVVAGRPLLAAHRRRSRAARRARSPRRAVEQMIAAIVPERLRATLEEQGSCDFALDRGPAGRFRVNVARQRTGLKACFRLIPPEVPTLASLGLPPEIEKATHHHQGLVVVTGPTGHGKTSTLAAIVDIINRETTHHVITVEDPIEFLHPRKKAMISQREVGTHTRSFAAALKASLREDPDVIVVGELRDTETVRMALAASETGHLVLGTMNTPSAAKTIDRLVDLFPPADQQQVRMTLAGGLHLIVSQRLVPAADGKGMVAAVELLPGSIALWSLIRDNKTFQIPSLQQRGKGFGIMRLDESLYDLVQGRARHAGGRARGRRVPRGARGHPRRASARPPAPRPPRRRSPRRRGGLLGKAGQLFGKRGRLRWPRIDRFFDALLAPGRQRPAPRRRLPAADAPARRARRDARRAPHAGGDGGAPLRDRRRPSRRRRSPTTLDLDFAYAYGDKARFRANYFYKTTGLARRLPHHPDQGAHARRPEVPAVAPQAGRPARRASCSSRAPRARASRRRSRR